VGYEPDLAYNIAVCHYKLNQFNPALKLVGEIIEKGMRDHPGMTPPAVIVCMWSCVCTQRKYDADQINLMHRFVLCDQN